MILFIKISCELKIIAQERYTMQKLLSWILSVVLVCLFVVSNSWAIDYTILSNQELYEFKGAVKKAPESEQKAYAKEWQKRLQIFTDEERKLYVDGSELADQQGNGKEKKAGKPFTPGKGYEQQGTGGVLFGGGSPDQDLR